MLNISLKTSESFTVGQQIFVEVCIINIGDKESSFNMPITSTGKLIYDFFKLTIGDGESIAYHGMLAKIIDSHIPIAAKEILSFTVDLSKEYLIDKEGNYSLQFNADHFNNQYYQIANNIVFTVLGQSLQPIITWYQLISTTQKTYPSVVKSFDSHKAFYATDQQFINLKEAHQKASEILENIDNCKGEFLKKFDAPYIVNPL